MSFIVPNLLSINNASKKGASFGVFFCANIALYLAVPGIYMFFQPESLFYWIYDDRFPQTVCVFLTFYSICIFIYRVGSLRLLPALRGARLLMERRNISLNTAIAIFPLVALSAGANYWLFVNDLIFVENLSSNEMESIPFFVNVFKNAHLLPLIVFGILAYEPSTFGQKRRSKKLSVIWVGWTLIALFTVAIGLLQGRRTAVLFPVILSLVLTFRNSSSWRTVFSGKVGAILCAGVLLFGMATYFRYSYTINNRSSIGAKNSDGISSIVERPTAAIGYLADSLIGRVGAPILAVNHTLNDQESGHLVRGTSPISAFASGLFLLPGSRSTGNFIGAQLGLISPQNEKIRINPSWPGEALFNYGLAGVAIFSCIFSAVVLLGSALSGIPGHFGTLMYFNTAFFIVSGFQMEIAFTLLFFLKVVLIGLALTIRFGASPESLKT